MGRENGVRILTSMKQSWDEPLHDGLGDSSQDMDGRGYVAPAPRPARAQLTREDLGGIEADIPVCEAAGFDEALER